MIIRALSDFKGPVDRLRTGRVRRYMAGDQHDVPVEVARYLQEQGLVEIVSTERKVVDAAAVAAAPEPEPQPDVEVEDEAEPADMVHVGGGWYELPNGDRVRGKENALEAARELAQ